MQTGIAPLLGRHRIFHSRDTEETQAFLHRKNFRCDFRREKTGELDACFNGIYMPALYIGYVHYGSLPVEFSPAPVRNEYWIQLPLRGQIEATIGRYCLDCNPRRATIASPVHEKCFFISSADNARIQVALPKGALIDHLAALLGEPPDSSLDFAPALDLTGGHGRSLARYLLLAAIDLDQPDSALLNPLTMNMFEQLIMTGLLLSHPHNYSDKLDGRTWSIAPRDVKRAIDYIESRLDAPIKLADLVAASGVPGRTLFKHFRDSKGTSPMRYLRNARFDKVREALVRAEPGNNVTAIAMAWGFSHMGRFAVDYRARFGESPSDTLRKSQAPGPQRTKH
jgi:AraC-like DNA-binding protein